MRNKQHPEKLRDVVFKADFIALWADCDADIVNIHCAHIAISIIIYAKAKDDSFTFERG